MISDSTDFDRCAGGKSGWARAKPGKPLRQSSRRWLAWDAIFLLTSPPRVSTFAPNCYSFTLWGFSPFMLEAVRHEVTRANHGQA